MKKFLFALLLISACQFQVPKDQYTFVQHLPSDPDRLNPVISDSGYSSEVYQYVYEQLFDLDNTTLQPKPRLAKRWEVSPDHLQYTFYLRDDVKWHDGQPFTADDVIYTYEKTMDPTSDSASGRNYYKDILKAEKLDRTTVRFTYRQPYFKAISSIGLMFIIPKHIFNDGREFNSHPNNRFPIGTGPFKFVEWRSGRRIVLERNENYWGEAYHFKKIVFRLIPDDLVAFQLFKKKELDIFNLTPLQWEKQTNTKKFQEEFVKHKYVSPFGSYGYIGWNLKRPVFQDKRVRQALAHLVNREYINEKLQFGLYTPITGPYFPFGPDYDPTLKPYSYDLERAKELLTEAGWVDRDGDGVREKDGKPFRFTFIFPSGIQFYERLTPILRNEFSKAGIDMELRRLEGNTMFQMLYEHDFDAYIAAWGRGAGGEDLYQIWHSSQIAGGSNFVSYQNPEVDRLLEEGRREFDPAKRSEIFKKVHARLHEDQPYLFMFAAPSLMARDNRFKNVVIYKAGPELKEWMVE